MNKKEKKRLTGIVGIVLLISGITGVIPSAVNNSFDYLIGFGILAVIGMVMTIMGFSE